MKRLLVLVGGMICLTVGCQKQQQTEEDTPLMEPIVGLQKVVLKEDCIRTGGLEIDGFVRSWTPQLQEQARRLVGCDVGCITHDSTEALEILDIQPWSVYEELLRKANVTEKDITRLCYRLVHNGKVYYWTSHTSIVLVQLPVQGKMVTVPVPIGYFLALR